MEHHAVQQNEHQQETEIHEHNPKILLAAGLFLASR
jgi:hypothetical protein